MEDFEPLAPSVDDFETLLAHQSILEAMSVLSRPWEGASGSPTPYPAQVRSVANLLLNVTDEVESAFVVEAFGDEADNHFSEATKTVAFAAVASASKLAPFSTPATPDQVTNWLTQLRKISLQVLRDGFKVRCERVSTEEAVRDLSSASLLASKSRTAVRIPTGGYKHEAVPTAKKG
jgi:hypothetical protein